MAREEQPIDDCTATLDRAIGDVQTLINACQEATAERMKAKAAMICLEHAAELLERSERMLRLHVHKDYRIDLHGEMEEELMHDIGKLMRGIN